MHKYINNRWLKNKESRLIFAITMYSTKLQYTKKKSIKLITNNDFLTYHCYGCFLSPHFITKRKELVFLLIKYVLINF